jgi:hypothetical protein
MTRTTVPLAVAATLALCGCSSDTAGGSSADGGAADGTTSTDGQGGAETGSEGSTGDDSPAGDSAGGGEGSTGADGNQPESSSTTPDGSDGGADDGPSGGEAGCTAPNRATSQCGSTKNCNGSTSLCLEGIVKNTCEPLPPECACAETLDCACLLAHVPAQCDAGHLQCAQTPDGGLVWIQDLFCP